MLDFKLNDPAALPEGFGVFADFVREDEIADGGAFDSTLITSGTLAINAAVGGWARLSAAGVTDNSGAQLQAKGAHAITAGKALCFKARAQMNEAGGTNTQNIVTESDLFLGFFPVDTAIEASLPIDGIYFSKPDGATALKVIVRQNGTNSVDVTVPSTLFVMDKSIHRYGIAVFPTVGGAAAKAHVEFSIDGNSVYRTPEPVNVPADTILLTPSIAFQSGDVLGTKFVDLDYMGSYQVR